MECAVLFEILSKVAPSALRERERLSLIRVGKYREVDHDVLEIIRKIGARDRDEPARAR